MASRPLPSPSSGPWAPTRPASFCPGRRSSPNRRPRRRRPNFNATDPNAYPAANWTPYDTAVRNAARYGITVDLIVAGGAPQWAEKKAPIHGYNPYFAWYPSDAAYGQFMTAVAKRYSGNFTPPGGTRLPRVRFWTIWNEPNFGQNLGPQAIGGSRYSVAPKLYRGLLNAGWKALHVHRPRPRHHPGRRLRRPRDPGRQVPRRLRPDQAAAVHPHPVLRRQNNRVLRGRIGQARGLPDERQADRGGSAPRIRRCSTPAASPITPTRTTGRRPPTAAGIRTGPPSRTCLASARCWTRWSGRTARASTSRSTTTSTATSPGPRPTPRVRRRVLPVAGDRRDLHQPGRVPELQERPDQVLHAVPAQGPAALGRPAGGASTAAWSSSTAPRRRPTSPTTCRCGCPRPRSRGATTSRCGATPARPASSRVSTVQIQFEAPRRVRDRSGR